jgi:hypothetical protein
MGLKKNFVFIAATKGKIDVLDFENFQTLFYINFLYSKPQYFKESGKKSSAIVYPKLIMQ